MLLFLVNLYIISILSSGIDEIGIDKIKENIFFVISKRVNIISTAQQTYLHVKERLMLLSKEMN